MNRSHADAVLACPVQMGLFGQRVAAAPTGRSTRISSKVFAGPTYRPSLDRARLTLQIERIRLYMLSVEWRTLREIKDAVEAIYASAVFPESSISAQLRNLKKPPYRFDLAKRRRVGGLWEYKLLPPARAEVSEKKCEPARNAMRDTRVDAGGEPDDGTGREEFLRQARRIAGLPS
jgi:hypothetical protein